MTSQHQQNFLRLQTAPSQPLYPSTTIQTLRKLVERSCTICLFIVYLFLLSPGLYAYAETYVSGTIAQDTTWTQAGSPYIVTADVTVRHLSKNGPIITLTIEPGVIIKFEPGTGLYIGYQYYGSYYGALVAQGTADQPIVFTSNAISPQPGDWKGVFLYDQADDERTIIEHCVIEYGGYTQGTNLYLQHASPTINNSVIRKSSSIGIYAEGSGSDNAVINGNHLEENVQGISLHTASPSITGNTMTANSYGMYLSINFPKMKAGDVDYGEFTLTNHGLIRADDLNFKLPEDDENFKYELLTGLPQSLEPKERITVPYKIICLAPLIRRKARAQEIGLTVICAVVCSSIYLTVWELRKTGAQALNLSTPCRRAFSNACLMTLHVDATNWPLPPK